MAWSAIPESLQSKLQSCTRSLIASTTCSSLEQLPSSFVCANVPSLGRWPGLSVPQALYMVSFVRYTWQEIHTFECGGRLSEYDSAKGGIRSVVVQETIAVEATINGGERESG
ncbi:hypothetical protein IG631_22880 [Alternaria alternata]|nr:hypothetical protein IG631_22880 [Alternaria alternata]